MDEFDNFILRAENNDGWQWSSAGGKPLYSRDEFAALTQLEMGSTGVHGRHVHVYINGFYWGMYNIVERPDDAFSSRYLGGEKEEWDSINSGEAVEGNLTAWNTMIALAQDVANAPDEVTRHAAYMKIQGLNPDGTDNPAFENYLNVDSLIDYMIVNIYTGNNDWPGHNWYTGRRRGPQSTGFHFYSWDAEWVLNLNSDVNTDKTGTSGSVTQPYALLRSSPEFRQRFADRAHNYFFNGGPLYVDPSNPNWDPTHPERNRPAARMVQLTNEIRDGVVGESARWGDQHGTNHHRGEWQNELNSLLTSYFPQRSAIVVNQLRNAGLYPALTAPAYNQHGGQIAPGFDLRMNAPAGTIYYTLDGSDPRLADGTLSPAAILYPATNTTTTLIPRNSSWKYLSDGSNQGTAWRNEGFVDTPPWPSGNGQLGYGEGDEATTIPRGPAGGGPDYITHYFRRTFTVTDAASITSLKVHLVRDDGAVVYINGQPATRSNMPEGEVNYLTPPLGSTGSPAENSYHELDVDPDLLLDGVNTIAVELHEISSGNSDASFDLDLIAYASSGAPPVILNETTTVKSRTLEGANWSALTEAYFNTHALANATNLKITEINYNPDVAGAGEPNVDNDEFEYIELRNVSAGTIDLRGVRFTAGIDFDFTASSAPTLAPESARCWSKTPSRSQGGTPAITTSLVHSPARSTMRVRI